MKRVYLFMLVLGIFLTMFLFPGAAAKAESNKLIYVVPVEHGIERGLEAFLKRAFQDAHEHQADAILLEIDTLGGEIGAADAIGTLIRSSEIPVIAFIKNNAISAGAYIALNADQIIMAPGSRMGAAAPVDLGGRMAEKKVVSYWTKSMESVARMNGRNPEIARGMVDPDVEIPGITKKGELISLDPETALKVGYCEKILSTRQEVIQTLFGDADHVDVVQVDLTLAEKLVRFVTHPVVMPILFLIGMIGVAVELLMPGFGWPGIVGVTAFGLYFFGHLMAGFAEWEHLVLFLAGIILLLVEIFVPGFGIFGAVGIVSLAAGLVLAAYDLTQGLISLGIAVVISLVILYFLLKYFGNRGLWNRIVLRDELSADKGYVAVSARPDLVGKEGIALTPLRPSGTVQIGNERVDVVTEGGFIPAGSEIVIVAAEGNRVVVRKK